jgi:hypothetical protein
MWATCCITPTSGGYLAFGEGCLFNHRGLYFKTTYSVAFGQRPPGSMTPLHPKQLKAKDPRLTKKYRKQVKAKMATSGFKLRFDDFKLKAKIEWNQQLQCQYNKLQKDNTAIKKEVESKVRKLRMGGVPWLPEITCLRNTIKLWSMMVRKKIKGQSQCQAHSSFLPQGSHSTERLFMLPIGSYSLPHPGLSRIQSSEKERNTPYARKIPRHSCGSYRVGEGH